MFVVGCIGNAKPRLPLLPLLLPRYLGRVGSTASGAADDNSEADTAGAGEEDDMESLVGEWANAEAGVGG